MNIAEKSAAKSAVYEARIKTARPFIMLARAAGAKNADQIAACLNKMKVPAPFTKTWKVHTVLNALKRLWQLGLDNGSLPPSEARAAFLYDRRHQDERRAAILANVGDGAFSKAPNS